MDEQDTVQRLWSRDIALWKEKPAHQTVIGNSFGWLAVADKPVNRAEELRTFSRHVVREGFKHVSVLGMGELAQTAAL